MPHTVSSAAVLSQDCALPADTALGVLVLNDVIAGCNERFCRMLGCTPADIVGKTFLELCPQFQADGAFSHERWTRRWHAARAGLPQWFPWQFRHCDGSRAHGLVHLATGPAGGHEVVQKGRELTELPEGLSEKTIEASRFPPTRAPMRR